MKTNYFEDFSTHLNQAYWKFKTTSLQRKSINRPFSDRSRNRVLIISLSGKIPQSQIFPFHYFSKDFESIYNAEFREIDFQDFAIGKPVEANSATTVAIQTPFDISDANLSFVADRLQKENPKAKYVYLDWCAPTDLRNAARVDYFVDFYIKKHILKDRSQYGKPTIGDTNLTDHYMRYFGLSGPEVTFSMPNDFNKKIIVGPSFCTSSFILPSFLKKTSPKRNRSYDLHARFDTQGADWYQAMRCEARDAIDNFSNFSILKGFGVGWTTFIRELRHSKICFSPFGYGEVCWRDFEAVMSGAVLLKPDMSHIETVPDIFKPWETYVPVRWDLSDLSDTLERVLSDEKLRRKISDQAYSAIHNYLNSKAFANGMHQIME